MIVNLMHLKPHLILCTTTTVTPDDLKTEFNCLLYYAFVRIDDPAELVRAQEILCRELGLRGRILVAHEGLNGTVSGTREACEHYMRVVHNDLRFANMTFKVDVVDGHVFRKLFVREKKEIVTFRSPVPVSPSQQTGKHLSPKEFCKKLTDPNVVVVDGRADYEYDIGHFEGALRPDIASFREFPEWIAKNLADAKDKTILTYCTGGIRCEKLTSYLMAEGFTDVNQLDGGIVSYGKDSEVQGALWKGLCYVFDERIAVEINSDPQRSVVGRCHHCGTETETYINCANMMCNKQHLSCDACTQQFNQSCSIECMDAPSRLKTLHSGR